MGNIFETECNTFLEKSAQQMKPPSFLMEIIQEQFREPFKVHKIIQDASYHWLSFSSLLRKKDFLAMAEQMFFLDPDGDGKKLYKLFRVKNSQGESVVNVPEIIAILVLLSNFGQ